MYSLDSVFGLSDYVSYLNMWGLNIFVSFAHLLESFITGILGAENWEVLLLVSVASFVFLSSPSVVGYFRLISRSARVLGSLFIWVHSGDLGNNFYNKARYGWGGYDNLKVVDIYGNLWSIAKLWVSFGLIYTVAMCVQFVEVGDGGIAVGCIKLFSSELFNKGLKITLVQVCLYIMLWHGLVNVLIYRGYWSYLQESTVFIRYYLGLSLSGSFILGGLSCIHAYGTSTSSCTGLLSALLKYGGVFLGTSWGSFFYMLLCLCGLFGFYLLCDEAHNELAEELELSWSVVQEIFCNFLHIHIWGALLYSYYLYGDLCSGLGGSVAIGSLIYYWFGSFLKGILMVWGFIFFGAGVVLVTVHYLVDLVMDLISNLVNFNDMAGAKKEARTIFKWLGLLIYLAGALVVWPVFHVFVPF